MDRSRSDFSETEISESLHIDQYAYRDPRMSNESFGTGVDESLVDFMEAERNASEDQYALALAELDKVDNDVALLQNRSVAGGIYNPQMSSDRYFESEYSGNEIEDGDETLKSREEEIDDEGHYDEEGNYDSSADETSNEDPDDFDKMMDEMVSVVESQTADESDDGRSYLSFNSSRYKVPHSVDSRSVEEEERSISVAEPYRVAPSVALARPALTSGRSFELDTSEKPLTRARSTPKLSKSGPSAHGSSSTGNQLGMTLSPLQRENKWASMPWITTRKSVSDFSDISNIDNDNVKSKIKTLKNEKDKQEIAYQILMDDNTNLSKELSIAKQTIDSLRLNPTMNITFPQQQPGTAIAGAIPKSARIKEQPKASNARVLPSPHATPKITNSPYKGPNSAQLTRNKPYLKQVNDDDDYDYPSPNFGKNHDRTVIQATPNRLSFDSKEEESADSFSDKENAVKANLWRTELTDMVDEICRSMSSYRDLVKMGQIDDSEREGVLENIGRNERKLEEDYITAKSEVGEKLLDPDGTIGSDIIRLGKDLANLKRQQELDAIKSMKKKASASSISSNRSSNATTVERNRSESPSRIPVQPAAEKYRRRNSRPSPVPSPQLQKNTVSQAPVKKVQPNSRKSSRKGSLTPQKSRDIAPNGIAQQSLADSGFDSRVTSKPMSEIRNSKIPSTRDIIDGRINSLSESLKRNPFEKNRKTEAVPGKSSEEEHSPSMRKTASFGISAAPIMKHSVTQTEREQQAARQRSRHSHSQRRSDEPKKIMSKYRSTGDIRNLNESDGELNSFSESATDAETVVRNRRRHKSPKIRRSLRSSRQNLAETTPQPSPSEYVYLKDEIDKLKDQLERQQHDNNHRPIIRASSGIDSSTNFEDSEFETRSSRKTNSIFSKLRKEIKGLREDLYKIATPKNRSRACSIAGDTDENMTEPQKQERSSFSRRQSQSPRRSQTHSIPATEGVPLITQPAPPNLTGGIQYMPFPVDSQNGMPFWLLPNKNPFAGSTPNLTLVADDAPRRSKSARLRVDYASDTNSERERRPSKKGTLMRAGSSVQVYDEDLDRRLRKVERASTKVDRGSRELIRSAQYKHYGYL